MSFFERPFLCEILQDGPSPFLILFLSHCARVDFRRVDGFAVKGELMPMRTGAVNKPDLLNDYINTTVVRD